MQQMKNLEITQYFECIGMIICLMEISANKVNGNKLTTRIDKLYSLDLEPFPKVRKHVVALRHILVHNPMDFDKISEILEDIKRSELYEFLCMLVNYIQIDVSNEYMWKVISVLYLVVTSH